MEWKWNGKMRKIIYNTFGNGMEMEIKWKIGIELNADLYFRQREMLQKYQGKIAVILVGGGLEKEWIFFFNSLELK